MNWANWMDESFEFMQKYLRRRGKEFNYTLKDLQAAQTAFEQSKGGRVN